MAAAARARPTVHIGPGGAVARTFDCLFHQVFGHHDADVLHADLRQVVQDDVVELCAGGAVPFSHATPCPAAVYAQQSERMSADPLRGQPVKIGAGTVPVNRRNEVLLTRRAAHLSLFPGYWVMPGGHVESHESLVDAALRELNEETGLRPPAKERCELLALWESTYPDNLHAGTPTKQHLVVFFTVPLDDEQPDVTLQLDECDAFVWASLDMLRPLLTNDDLPRHADCPASLTQQTLAQGHRFALTQWLLKHSKR